MVKHSFGGMRMSVHKMNTIYTNNAFEVLGGFGTNITKGFYLSILAEN
jgi:hypothetical protein